MSLRTHKSFLHTKVLWGLVFAAAALAACGSTTSLGDEKSDAGAPGGSGNAAGGGISTGTAGRLGAGGTPGCTWNFPEPSSPAEEQRVELMRAYCNALAKGSDQYSESCLYYGELWAQSRHCSIEEQVSACMVDRYYDYIKYIPPACDSAWQRAIACAARIDFAADGADCASALFLQGGGAIPFPCGAESLALRNCVGEMPSVTGTRATCFYGREFSDCTASCSVGTDNFHSVCAGEPGLPLYCLCFLNGHAVRDDGDGNNGNYFVNDCRAAAELMANGKCLDAVDCCFTWVDAVKKPRCSCTSDPSKLGAATCEEAAQARGGTVVELCSHYDFVPGCTTCQE